MSQNIAPKIFDHSEIRINTRNNKVHPGDKEGKADEKHLKENVDAPATRQLLLGQDSAQNNQTEAPQWADDAV